MAAKNSGVPPQTTIPNDALGLILADVGKGRKAEGYFVFVQRLAGCACYLDRLHDATAKKKAAAWLEREGLDVRAVSFAQVPAKRLEPDTRRRAAYMARAQGAGWLRVAWVPPKGSNGHSSVYALGGFDGSSGCIFGGKSHPDSYTQSTVDNSPSGCIFGGKSHPDDNGSSGCIFGPVRVTFRPRQGDFYAGKVTPNSNETEPKTKGRGKTAIVENRPRAFAGEPCAVEGCPGSVVVRDGLAACSACGQAYEIGARE